VGSPPSLSLLLFFSFLFFSFLFLPPCPADSSTVGEPLPPALPRRGQIAAGHVPAALGVARGPRAPCALLWRGRGPLPLLFGVAGATPFWAPPAVRRRPWAARGPLGPPVRGLRGGQQPPSLLPLLEGGTAPLSSSVEGAVAPSLLLCRRPAPPGAAARPATWPGAPKGGGAVCMDPGRGKAPSLFLSPLPLSLLDLSLSPVSLSSLYLSPLFLTLALPLLGAHSLSLS